VVSHQSIENAVWPGQIVSYASLARCVYSLRQKLNDQGKAILATVAKQGYRITVPVAIIRDEHFSTLERSIRTQPLAHSHFRAGMQASNSPDAESLGSAIEMFRKAIDIDPEYAVAYAAIADVRMYQILRGYSSPRKGSKEILAACDAALSIDSILAPAFAVKGWC
jgi:DNA-binding winged helix-turn-helix (wHTH) protein